MRLAYLINQYPQVSHTFIRREIFALERRGFEVMRISLRGWNDKLVDLDDLSEQRRTRFVLKDGLLALVWPTARTLLERPHLFFQALLSAGRRSRQSKRSIFVHLGYLAEACRALIWVRESKIEHIHAHFGTNSADVAMLVNLLGGPAWSFTVHGSELIGDPQVIGLSEKIARCAFVVAVSSFGRAQLYRTAKTEYWPKIHLIRCGLEMDLYTNSRPISDNGYLISIGRLSREKGYLLLLQAAARLAGEGVKFELRLAGDGPLRSELQRYISDNNLGSRVNLAGWLSNEQVRQEIVACRALVLSSLMEGLPVVLMEAMALKRPVIATCVGGIPELVSDGEHGWLVPTGDADALADAMRACLEASVSTLQRFGEAGFKQIIARHNVDKEVAKLAELFSTYGARPSKASSVDRASGPR